MVVVAGAAGAIAGVTIAAGNFLIDPLRPIADPDMTNTDTDATAASMQTCFNTWLPTSIEPQGWQLAPGSYAVAKPLAQR